MSFFVNEMEPVRSGRRLWGLSDGRAPGCGTKCAARWGLITQCLDNW